MSEFDESAARIRAWQVFGHEKPPENGNDEADFITTYMIEQSRWQWQQDKKKMDVLMSALGGAKREFEHLARMNAGAANNDSARAMISLIQNAIGTK